MTDGPLDDWFDRLADAQGITRDPQAEEQALVLGRLLALEAPALDEAGWARWAAGFQGLGSIERIVLWREVIAPGPDTFRCVFRPGEDAERLRCKKDYDEFMLRAKGAHRHLAQAVLHACGVETANLVEESDR